MYIFIHFGHFSCFIFDCLFFCGLISFVYLNLAHVFNDLFKIISVYLIFSLSLSLSFFWCALNSFLYYLMQSVYVKFKRNLKKNISEIFPSFSEIEQLTIKSAFNNRICILIKNLSMLCNFFCCYIVAVFFFFFLNFMTKTENCSILFRAICVNTTKVFYYMKFLFWCFRLRFFPLY